MLSIMSILLANRWRLSLNIGSERSMFGK
jgi:hypothetical protein